MKIELSNDIQNELNNFSVPEQVGFGQTLLPIMITSQYEDGKWSPLEISPYADLRIDPSMKVLHYAQEIFEGLKGYISENDQALLFSQTKMPSASITLQIEWRCQIFLKKCS